MPIQNMEILREQLVNYSCLRADKIAPEHCDNDVLALMNKPFIKTTMRFKELFDNICTAQRKSTFYDLLSHGGAPGCTLNT